MFGTDGIRGVAGESPLTKREIYRLGLAAGHVLKSKNADGKKRILIVRDTRGSGEWILAELAKGLRDNGIDVFDAGVLCTPSVAYLVKAHGYDAGVVISASHNPPEFNGIKFFTPQGFKWPDAWENIVEEKFFSNAFQPAAKRKGTITKVHEFHQDYEAFLLSSLPDRPDLSWMRVAIDCSNGANHKTAPDVIRRLGATIFALGTSPNGRNINVGCGSQKTEKLARLVVEKKCHIGLAFDGDGDRLILVDERGRTLDGDHILALLAKFFKKKKILRNNRVVITVMANLGLKKALTQLGVKVSEVSVGDRYVSAEMRKKNSILGGEQSGHIILGAHLPTGDGLLTALHVLNVLDEERRRLSELVAWMKKYPQVLLNVPVKERTPIAELDHVSGKISSVEKILGSNGRVLVRYSGTEPLLRIMLEGPNKNQLTTFANDIAKAVILAGR